MRKQIAIIFICVLSFTTITGCGIKGPLYQTPEQQQDNSSTTDDKTNKSNIEQ